MLSCVPWERVTIRGILPRINIQGPHSWRTGSAGPEPSRPAHLSGLLGDDPVAGCFSMLEQHSMPRSADLTALLDSMVVTLGA
jgi:hypothetical protein